MISLVAVAGLVACQHTSIKPDAEVVSLYRSQADALAVATGHFGSVPIALERVPDLTVVGAPSCDAKAMEVRTPAGVSGWSVAALLTDITHCPR